MSQVKKRSVGIQSVVPLRERINPKIASCFPLEELDYPKFALVPHTLTSLILIVALVIYASFYSTIQQPFLSNKNFDLETEKQIFQYIIFYFKIGFIFVVAFGVTYLPDSLMRRPHPIFWRFLFSVGFFYSLLLLAFCLLPTDDSKYLLRMFDDNLNKPLAFKSYGENCSVLRKEYPYIDLSEIWVSVDVYVLAHFVGWFVKYLAFRNIWLAMFMSVFFELMEMTFSHWLNNFIECWWDHLFLDVLGMNLIGIILGYLTVKYYNMKSYKWLANDETQNKPIKDSILFKLFVPSHTDVYDWDMLSSSRKYFGVLWFICIFTLCELAHFFIKFTLWLPITHYLLIIRIFIWGFLSIMSIREYYEYIINKENKKIGHFLWLAHMMLILEWILIIKASISQNLFTEPFPNTIKNCWISVIVILGLVGFKVILTDIIKYCKEPSKQNRLNEITIEEY